MKTLLLVGILALSFQSASFAGQTSSKDCAAFAESNERTGKDLKSEKKTETKKTKAKAN